MDNERLHSFKLDHRGAARVFGELEATVMEAVWQLGEPTVGDVCDALGPEANYKTVNGQPVVSRREIKIGDANLLGYWISPQLRSGLGGNVQLDEDFDRVYREEKGDYAKIRSRLSNLYSSVLKTYEDETALDQYISSKQGEYTQYSGLFSPLFNNSSLPSLKYPNLEY